ncbi:MAG: ribonuclease Y [Myxococcales bacterium]|nr:ribonuclease Y [Myxococcales bacterium]
MTPTTATLLAIGAAIVGLMIGFIAHKRRIEQELGTLEKHSKDVLEKAQKEGDQLLQQLQHENDIKQNETRRELENEFKERRRELEKREERLDQRFENIQKQGDLLNKREEEINKRLSELNQRADQLTSREERLLERQKTSEDREKDITKKLADVQVTLEKSAGMSREEAKRSIVDAMMEEARTDAARQLRVLEEETRDQSEKQARRILAIATQRYANEFVTESTVSVVHLPSDDMKGRIIGREGRNIRALEAATGVDLIIDDTPEAVVVSCFDPIRREVARRSLEKLVSDGRIHPARIEEIVEKTNEEMDGLIKEAGEEAVLKLGLHRIHPEIKKMLGRLKWRYSYGQNQWEHSIECGFLCGLMAAELGLNVRQARRAALLHDIGKAMSHELEGSHALNGANFLQKYGEHKDIVHAVAAHHEEIKPETALAYLVITADSLSGGRPGARREALESYIQRLHDLEAIATSFDGVEKAYAIQAGRELRVITACNDVNDDQVVLLCRDITRKIEREMTYPGQIKVTVIRETRMVDYAR